jgi:hypothetical protein
MLRYATLYIRVLKKKFKKNSKKNSKISVNFFFQMFCAYGLPRPIWSLPANIFFLGGGLGLLVWEEIDTEQTIVKGLGKLLYRYITADSNAITVQVSREKKQL